MLKAVIFDMDGVLIDSETAHYLVLKNLLAEYGYDYTAEHFCRYCGVSEMEMWPQLLAESGIPLTPERAYEMHWQRYRQQQAQNGLRAFPGTGRFLESLRTRGYRLAVASSSEEPVIRNNMQQLNYAPYFDCMVSACICEHSKPWPDVFLLAADRLGVAPADCIVVEDSQNGMIAAQNAGMKWVGFCGAQLPMDMSLAPFVFSDYRSITPQDFAAWHDEFSKQSGRTEK